MIINDIVAFQVPVMKHMDFFNRDVVEEVIMCLLFKSCSPVS